MLENRVRELTEGNQDDKTLQELRLRNERLEKELRYLKESLALPGHNILPPNFAYPTCKYLSLQLLLPTALPNPSPRRGRLQMNSSFGSL